MNPEEYAIMYQAEQSHWWYRGMERVTRAIIERWYAPGMDLRILDAGCGTGGVMEYMEEYGNVTGIDFAAEAMCFCRERGKERVTRASLMAFPFSESKFPVGSSAKMILGSLIRARHMATRCISPPES